jgi:hypothetical protein
MMRSMAQLLALALTLSLFGCSKGVTGIYVNDKNKRDYLELRSDSTFFLREHGMGVSGKYRIDGEVITLTLDAGPSVQGKLHGAVITDDEGQTWARGERPAGSASAGSPNVSPPRQAANESGAASSLRSINTAEVTYATMYPTAGYAPNLSSLSTGGSNCSTPTAVHACLIDQALGCASAWCVKYGYQFTIVSTAKAAPFADYTATATPVDGNSGRKNFCSTADAVIREQTGPPLTKPLTLQECAKWTPLM